MNGSRLQSRRWIIGAPRIFRNQNLTRGLCRKFYTNFATWVRAVSSFHGRNPLREKLSGVQIRIRESRGFPVRGVNVKGSKNNFWISFDQFPEQLLFDRSTRFRYTAGSSPKVIKLCESGYYIIGIFFYCHRLKKWINVELSSVQITTNNTTSAKCLNL